MKRTRAQNPKAQEQEPPQDAGSNTNPKPQRRAKQPRQPKKTAVAREAAAAAATAAAAAAVSPAEEMTPVVPDVSVGAGGGGGGEVACGLPAEWDEMDGSPWWTFGVEEEKLLGWFPFVEEDFRPVSVAGAEPACFDDDDIWRIHQIYEIPSYAAK
ncbi:PHD finger protein rhinoceros-like [Hordeum vulgare subsp. vulgare]|uniref:Uncharacterized protein n=1 Tax=Hordeum vulgare subsp. vulgare TaxID=112509 RepID=A0A8I7B4I8_HORVV|nr:PHD finger protein rhinoceros-like [Hordeum vulgare subsp. vulgare]KAI5004121.1 hypothetical protein ZWY2020_031364 [Hordeum vulgare]